MRSEEETVSVWMRELREMPADPPLIGDMNADVCVVGAGIAGLTTAYLLLKEGKSVVIVDAVGVAAGETGRTTAHLTWVMDDRFSHLESLIRTDETLRVVESHQRAVDMIEAIITQEHIDCDFERIDGFLTASDSEQEKIFGEEVTAIRHLGLQMDEMDEITVPGVNVGRVMRFHRQGTFNAGKYMAGLAHAVRRMGGRIFTGRVVETKGGGAPFIRTEDGAHVYARAVVVATNTPINDRVTMHTKQYAYRTYVIGCAVDKGAFPGFLLWDLGDPYHYVRPVRGDVTDLLIIGGEDHKTGQANDAAARYRALESWARARIPALGPVVYRWSGQIMEPVDSLAFIGRNPGDDHVFIATGDSGHGMTHGTIAGIVITDMIVRGRHPWAELYDPARKSVKTVGTYVGENVNAVGHMVGDWLAPAEVSGESEIIPGQGAIMRDGASKIAVYRDEDGGVHKCSAVCTHLGCVVQWNGGEKSWDCPCHGSRYDANGKVLNGPASAGLAPVDEHGKHLPPEGKRPAVDRRQ